MTRVVVRDEQGNPLFPSTPLGDPTSPNGDAPAAGPTHPPSLPQFHLFDLIALPRAGSPGSFDHHLVLERIWTPNPQGFDLTLVTRPISGSADRRRALEDLGYLAKGEVKSSILTR
jgi:hypothetical protein